MATDILIKRSSTPGAVPTTGDLSTGELAINTADKRLFTNNSGTIVEIGTAPTSLAVTNNATVGGTLGVTGNTTLSGTLSAGATTLASGSVSGNFAVTGTLTVATPSNSTDAASKGYVDTAVSNVIDAAPDALNTLNELAAALNDDANFATTVTNALAGKLALAGGTMTGDITLGANKITSTATPATDDTLTRKGYVDSILGSATDAATSATAAASSATDAANSASAAATSASNASTSATNAASSASAASTSATNAATSATASASSATSASNSATASANSATAAATSATNAENAYDSFDDRYLGAKTSDPSVDNDGDALITGALYFNTTDDAMKVYDGSAWNEIKGANATFTTYKYTATSGQTAFTGADDDGATLAVGSGGAIVTLNGVVLEKGTDYTTTSTTVTLTTGATTDDELNVLSFESFEISDVVPASTGGTFSGAVTVTDTLTATGLVTAQDGLVVDNDGATVATFDRATSDGTIVDLQKDGSSVGSINVDGGKLRVLSDDKLIVGDGDTGLNFRADIDAIFPWDTTTDLIRDGGVDLGRSVGRFKDLYLSGGVYLGGTGSANYLDDYEEGTFTLTLNTVYGGGANFTNTVPGRYVKIGKVVHCEFRTTLNGSNAVAVDDRFKFTGLPFAPDTDQNAQGMLSLHSSYSSGNSSHWNVRAGSNNEAFLWCFHEDGAVTYGALLQGSITYEVA